MGPTWRFPTAIVLLTLSCRGGLPVVAQCECQDKEPRDSEPCLKQRESGKCGQQWIIDGNYCEKSCSRCTCEQKACGVCDETPPDGEFSCQEQKDFGKCDSEWMQPYCQITCERCACGDLSPELELTTTVPGETRSKSGSKPKRKRKARRKAEGPSRPNAGAQITQGVPQPDASLSLQPQLEDSTSSAAASSSATKGPASISSPESVPTLTPSPKKKGQACTKSVLEVLEEGNEFGTLINALKETGVSAALTNPTASLALFAPHDMAFNHFFDDFKLAPEEFVTTYLHQAEAILQYHIVPEAQDPDTLTRSSEPLSTLLTSKKLFSAGKTLIEALASSARIKGDAIPVCSSYIFIVDALLLPAPSLEGIGRRRAIQHTPQAPSIRPLPVAHTIPTLPVTTGGANCVEGGSLAQTLMGDPHLQFLSQGLEVTGLAKKYLAAWDDRITVLGPTDAAFRNFLVQVNLSRAELMANKKMLEEVLKYHLVPGNFNGTSFQQGSLQTLASVPIYVEELPGHIEIGGLGSSARITMLDADQQCHGALHIIDQVLLPFPISSHADINLMTTRTNLHKPVEPQPVPETSFPSLTPLRGCKSVADVVATTPNLRILRNIIELTGLESILSDFRHRLTLFAPTDDAFIALSQSAHHLPILGDPAALKSIIGYHVLSRPLELDDLVAGRDFPTMVLDDEEPLELSILRDTSDPNGVLVKGVVGRATIITEDISACDSIVHIVDGVLLPSDELGHIGDPIRG